ncbi:MAG: tyrosine--tRNA ligase [Candidatus Omnitrophota bacterium]
MTPEQQLELIKRGTMEIVQEKELLDKLRKKKQLIVKAGFDPTAPDIHLGHTVLLRKLRHFQECGHKVIFLIGDATALVGDPSGQSATRKPMTREEVERNAKTYEQQVAKILDTKNPSLFARRHNSAWFARNAFGFEQMVELAGKITIARLLERDDFQKRLKENRPISYLETFYPLMQGYDSVMLTADVEVGGTDQKFNLLVGRELQREYRQEPQVIITTPLLEGLDGVQKMSKSLGNHIGINESPKEIFGKVMSVSDEMMWKYYELLTDENLEEMKKLHPREAKKHLASFLVSQYHGKPAAERAGEEFERSVGKGLPQENPKYPLISEMKTEDGKAYHLPKFLAASGVASSASDARRKIEEKALKYNGTTWLRLDIPVSQVKIGDIFQIGKKSVEVSGIS